MKKSKKEIKRQCISCREEVPRQDLIRIAKVPRIGDGKSFVLIVNPNNYQLGRSAYICKKINCIEEALKKKKIAKMLRVSTDLLCENIKLEVQNILQKEVRV